MSSPHPYEKEVRSFLALLKKHGVEVTHINDGGDETVKVKGAKDLRETILSVDDSWLYVSLPSGSKAVVYIMLGNGPGEMVCDYTSSTFLDAITDAHYTKWSD